MFVSRISPKEKHLEWQPGVFFYAKRSVMPLSGLKGR